MKFEQKENYDIFDLIEIVRILRAPNGCPWDKEQTHESIRTCLIEECYEVCEAIDTQDSPLLLEELGDLLLQIVLHAQMEAEDDGFTFSDVCNEISKKLVFRHPHVFGGLKAEDEASALAHWEKMKNAEKGRNTAADRLQSVPATLPALMNCQKVQKRADAFGYGYDGVQQAFDDLESEIAELKQALLNGEKPDAEAGDILFSAANVARLINVDAEKALTDATKRFTGRVMFSEEEATRENKTLAELKPSERNYYWKKAKEQE